MPRITLVFLLFFSFIYCAGQDIKLKRDQYAILYGQNNGLTTSNIYDLIQDKEGYLYIATDLGVFKYNGQTFKSFSSHVNKYMAGSGLGIYKENKIFFESFDGYVYLFNQDNNYNIFNKNKPVHYLNYGLYKDTLFVIQKKGLDIYNLEQKKLLKTINYDLNNPTYAKQINENYYVIDEVELLKFNSKKLLKSIKLKHFEQLKKIHQLYEFDNKIYVVGRSGYQDGILVFDLNLNFLYKVYVNEINAIVQSIEFLDNQIYVSTNKGLYIYREINKQWQFKEILFPNTNISKVLKGQNGELWISAIGVGLYLVPNSQQFVYNISNETIVQFSRKDSNFIVGTNTGNIYDLYGNFSKSKFITQAPSKTPIHYLYNNTKTNDLFFVPDMGFYHYNLNQKKFFDLALKSVLELDEKYYVLATSSHLIIYPKKENAHKSQYSIWDELFEQNKIEDGYAPILNGLRSKTLCFDQVNKEIYVLTNIGVYVVNSKGETRELLSNNQPITAQQITYNRGNLYYLNYTQELFIYRNNKSVKLDYDKKILDFKLINKELILKTENGFVIYDIDRKKFNHINFKCDPNSISNYTINGNNLAVLTAGGITEIPINYDNTKNNFPKFILENVKVKERIFSSESLPDNFAYHENNFEINFSIIDYVYASSYSTFYRINNGEWKIIPSNNRKLQFPSLSPGKYTIEFKIDEVIIDNKIDFIINQPFWLSWPFYVLISSFVILVITYIFNERKKKFDKEIKLLEEKVLLEKKLGKSILTSVKAQMNPHFYFNALNSIQAFIYKNDKVHALEYLSKFSKLTRKILSQTEKETIALDEEISMLKLYLDLEQVRFSNRFNYKINIDGDLQTDKIRIPAMLIQPYVENCVKHGFNKLVNNGLIQITFKKEIDVLKVTVEDNGVGRPVIKTMDKKYKESFSSEANLRRLEILNANSNQKVSVKYTDLKDHRNVGIGTIVTIYIPIEFIDIN